MASGITNLWKCSILLLILVAMLATSSFGEEMPMQIQPNYIVNLKVDNINLQLGDSAKYHIEIIGENKCEEALLSILSNIPLQYKKGEYYFANSKLGADLKKIAGVGNEATILGTDEKSENSELTLSQEIILSGGGPYQLDNDYREHRFMYRGEFIVPEHSDLPINRGGLYKVKAFLFCSNMPYVFKDEIEIRIKKRLEDLEFILPLIVGLFAIGGSIAGFYINDHIMNRRKMKNKVYAPLHTEVEKMLNDVFRRNEKRSTEEWVRITEKEHYNYYIKPSRLREKIVVFYSQKLLNYNNLMEAVHKGLKENITNRLAGLLDTRGATPQNLHQFINNLVLHIFTRGRSLTFTHAQNYYKSFNVAKGRTLPELKNLVEDAARWLKQYDVYKTFEEAEQEVIGDLKYIKNKLRKKAGFRIKEMRKITK